MKAAFFWKTMLVVIILKYYIKVSFRQFKKTLNQFFQPPSANESLETCITCLIWVIERIKAFLRYFYWKIFKQMDIISKMQNIMFAKSYYMSSYNYHDCHLQ